MLALDDARLRIRPGELVALLGPSGCGKTTLLNLVAGFLHPDGGAIRIDGRAVTDVPPYRREIGMLFQSYALFPHMSVEANVAYGLKARRVPRDEIRRRVAEALALVRLTGFETRMPKQLSGGQQQRVALARALVIRPKVLLLDEPFSALDKSLRASMQLEVKAIQRRVGVTTLFVTHDQGEALSLSDRIAVLSAGRIRQVGTPEDIYRKPADRFVASFVGDVNVLPARLDRVREGDAVVAAARARVAVPSEPLLGRPPGSAVDLFVRPEALRLAGPDEDEVATGIVADHVYGGSHVDVYVSPSENDAERLHVQVPRADAARAWPVGAAIRLAVDGDAVAFPPE